LHREIARLDVLLVLCTCPDESSAAQLARALVEEGLAACVNRLPGVRSTWRWEGAIQDASEVMLVIKTVEARFEALRERLVALHPYELPEVIAVKVAAGLAPYLRWIEAETAAAAADDAIDQSNRRSP
jgi:periplasmic divalent cation tolerance protein